MITLNQIHNLPADVIDNTLKSNGLLSISPLNDRLEVINLFNNAGQLTPQDSTLFHNENFKLLYTMDEEDLLEMGQLYDIFSKSRIDIIRNILNTELFGITIMGPDEIIHHGTHYKLIGNIPYTPGYFSRDIIQSLGHIMRDFKELSDSYYNSNFIALDKKINDLVCFPSIYSYRFSQNTPLLVLKYPHISRTFSLLFNPEVLARYVDKNLKKRFVEKLTSTLQVNPSFFQTKSLIKIIEFYQTACMDNCFGGWTNTPGYFLLNSIDYNRYFQEIGIIDYNTRVGGLYIPKDQDEIVLLGDVKTTIYYISQSYVLPYEYINRNLSVAAEFIENYIHTIAKYKRDRTNLLNIVNISDKYNSVNTEKWNFSWYLTNSDGKIRIGTNDIEDRFEHKLLIRSSKIDFDTKLKFNLVLFVKIILTQWDSRNFEGVDQLCNFILPLDRTFIPYILNK